ncbi:MAG TPA: alpha/beta fold hydrolase [Trebonia sp.]|nr:alpha/beta fold hydrolase [Trebonia sp.]
MNGPSVRHFPGRDGVPLAYRETGDGRPLILIHGFTASGLLMLQHGPASALAGHGYRVIAPDLRGHGDSARPHDPAAYPPDVLAEDGLALIDWLGLDADSFDLVGYSLGGRVVLRLLARGAQPGHAVVAGQGLDALDATSGRTDGHRRLLARMVSGEAFAPGTPEALAAQWITERGGDPRAMSLVLDSFTQTPVAALRAVAVPTLVVVGDKDVRGDTAADLAASLGNGDVVRVPGDHGSALMAPELTAAILDFLARGPQHP